MAGFDMRRKVPNRIGVFFFGAWVIRNGAVRERSGSLLGQKVPKETSLVSDVGRTGGLPQPRQGEPLRLLFIGGESGGSNPWPVSRQALVASVSESERIR